MSYSYLFTEYKDACNKFYRAKLKDKSYCFVILGVEKDLEGLYVEKDAKGEPNIKVLRSIAKVKEFELFLDDVVEANINGFWSGFQVNWATNNPTTSNPTVNPNQITG